MFSIFYTFLTIATTQTSAAPGWQIAETLRADQVDRRSTKNVGVAIQSWWLSGYLRIGSLNLLIDIVAKGPANGEEWGGLLSAAVDFLFHLETRVPCAVCRYLLSSGRMLFDKDKKDKKITIPSR